MKYRAEKEAWVKLGVDNAQDFKLELAAMYRAEPIRVVADYFGITLRGLYFWLDRYKIKRKGR